MNTKHNQAVNLLAAIGVAMMLSACAVGTGRYDATTGIYDPNAPADPVVVHAESVMVSAQSTFANFMQFEKNNRDMLWNLNPGIKRAADEIRTNGKIWLDQLDDAIDTYQRARTLANRTNLDNVLDLIENSLQKAERYLAYGNS